MKKMLLTALAVALSASVYAVDKTVAVKATTGTIVDKTWTSKVNAGVPTITIILPNGGIFNETTLGADSSGQNVGDNLVLGTSGATRTVSVYSDDDNYYVSAISMKVRGIKGDKVTFASGSTTLDSDGTDQTVTFTYAESTNDATFTITPETQGQNKKAICQDFTITLSERTQPYINPEIIYESLNRSNWQITVCSEAGNIEDNNGVNGRASAMFDDKLNTYHHQNWSSDKPADAYHWFFIDLGEEQDIDGFDYWRRQNSSNGQLLAGKIYVSNTPFTAFTNHSGTDNAAKAYVENSSNVAAASFTFNYDTDADAVRSCRFSSTQKGRYVLLVATQAGMANGGTHFCCAEFKLVKKSTNLSAIYESGLNHANVVKANSLASLHGAAGYVLPSLDCPVNLTMKNVQTAIDYVNNTATAYINAINNSEVYIKCGYRREEYPYLAAISTGTGIKLNTQATVNPDAVWKIILTDNGVKLYNKASGYYIGDDQTARNQGQVFIPGVINGNYVKFTKLNDADANLLNVNGQNGDLTQWSDQSDQGSSWIVARADYNYDDPVVSTAEAPRYYRMVNARYMYQNDAPVLTGVGENQAETGVGKNVTHGRGGNPYTYWRLEQKGNAVRLVNLTGYALQHPGQAGQVTMSADGADCFLFKQTASEFGTVNCYGISRDANGANNTYLDGNGDTISFVWTPTSNGAHNLNGTLWYFIAANEEEVSAAAAKYLEDVRALVKVAVADPNLAELFGEEFAESLAANYTTDIASAKSLNAAKVGGDQTDAVNAVKTAVEGKIATELAGKHFVIKNANTNYSNCYMTVANDSTSTTSNRNDINAIWTLEPTENGTYYIRALHNGGALGRTDAQSKPIIVTETESKQYVIAYNPINPGFTFTKAAETEGENTRYYTLHQSNNNLICKWQINSESENKPIAGSHWHLLALADEVTPSYAKITGGHTISLPEGVSVNTHDSATDLRMTVTKRPDVDEISLFSAVSPINGVHSIAASDFTEGSVTLEGLEKGTYDVEAPAGMFLVNGQPSQALSSSFSINGNGNVTGLSEIIGNDPAAIFYDLQGRRQVAPVRGVNIINGKKILVK